MKILYDISVLGLGHYYPRARTGIFRVVENIAHGLANSEECDLNLCASLSLENVNQAIDYLQTNQVLENNPFISPGFSKDLHKNLNSAINKINEQPKIGVSLKVIRRSLYYLLKFIEQNTQVLNEKELSTIDLFHSPFYPFPETIKLAKNTKKIITIYDLIPIFYPKFFGFNEDSLIKNIVTSLDNNDWVICISHSTKNDLCNYQKNIDSSRVFVTHLAASELFYPCHNSEQINLTKTKYHIADVPYILSLSTLEPRKNIAHTIRCFVKLVQQENIKDLYLVLVGTKGWDYDNIFDEISNSAALKDRIIITGYVDDEDLAALYSGAIAFVYPSLYEGFGLPPLEAMQCGVPVITSNTSSLPEVVGDAGIMVSPTDADLLCQSMLDIYHKSSLREAMSLKSIEQAKKFSWQRCTQETINAYKAVLKS